MTLRSRLRRAFRGSRADEPRTWTIVGTVTLDENGRLRSSPLIAGIVEGEVVTIEEELTGDDRTRRFLHPVRARSYAEAEAESQAYLRYVSSLIVTS